MSNPLDTVLFDGKTSADVFKEIYTNSKKKDKQVNSLIGTFNNFAPNINSNTPADTPVTQIQEFDRNLEVDTEDSSQLNPSTFPQFLGGDGITTQDNDNVLFD